MADRRHASLQICDGQDSKRLARFQGTRTLPQRTRSASKQTQTGSILNSSRATKPRVMDSRQAYFAQMATRIQARWRGYASRKYVHDFYCRKHYIQGILDANSATRILLKEAEEETQVHLEQKASERKTAEMASKLDRMHHLLSTACVPGTLVSQTRQDLDASLGTGPLEETVRQHKRLSRGGRGQKHAPVEKPDASTIRVAGPFEHVREEQSLERRVEKAYAAMCHSQPFTSFVQNSKAWNPLTTSASSDRRPLKQQVTASSHRTA